MFPKWLARVSDLRASLGPKTPLLEEMSPPHSFTVHFPSPRQCFFSSDRILFGFFNKNGEFLENLVFSFWIWLIFLISGKKITHFLFFKLKNKPLLPDDYKINIFNTYAYTCLTYFWDTLQIHVLIYLFCTYSSLYFSD
jgi:hypothetical protein